MSDLNKLKELESKRQGVFGMMAGSTHPRTGKLITAEKETLRLIELVNDYGEVIERLEAAEQRVAEITGKYEEVSGWYAKMKTRMLAAEAELARRDEAAGEPVGYTNIAGLEALSKGFVVSVCPDARQIDSLPLYTAAQPSALPPLAKLKDAPTDDVESAIPWLAGANCMREQAKALGCKAIKLPKPYGMQDHEKWLAQAEVIAAILAAGFTVECD